MFFLFSLSCLISEHGPWGINTASQISWPPFLFFRHLFLTFWPVWGSGHCVMWQWVTCCHCHRWQGRVMVECGCWVVVVVCGQPGMFVVVEVMCGRHCGRWLLRWWLWDEEGSCVTICDTCDFWITNSCSCPNLHCPYRIQFYSIYYTIV